jgi:benzoylformate decarboxylase
LLRAAVRCPRRCHARYQRLPGLDVPAIDFCSIAKGYGVDARQATSGETFAATLRQALASHRPMLIEVTTQADAI